MYTVYTYKLYKNKQRTGAREITSYHSYYYRDLYWTLVIFCFSHHVTFENIPYRLQNLYYEILKKKKKRKTNDSYQSAWEKTKNV